MAKIKKKSQLNKLRSIHYIIFIFLIVWVCTVLFLYLWGAMTSFKSSRDFLMNKIGLPKEWDFSHYGFVIKNYYVPITDSTGIHYVWLENMLATSLIYALGAPSTSLLVACWVAYLTARFKYKFSYFLNTLVIVVMFIPSIGTDVSTITILKSLGIFDTYLSIFVLNFSFMGTNYLLFYATLNAMPRDFIEAAKIDGANEMVIFFKIVLPSVSTLFFTLLTLGAITSWNNYSFTLTYLPTHPNLSYGVFSITETTLQGFNHVPVRMAAYYILVFPILFIFLLLKDYIIEHMNFSLGELKG